jgi:acyl-CoA thioesterase FadM
METNKTTKRYIYHTNATLRLLNPEGNVYFSKYFDIMGDARELFAIDILPNFKDLIGKLFLLKTVETSAKYKKDFYFTDKIEVQIFFKKVREASILLGFDFINSTTKEIHATAEQLLAITDLSGNIISLPPDWKKLLQEYME